MKLKSLIILIIIEIFGVSIRYSRLFEPFIKRHGWNEAIYASVALDFVSNHRRYPFIVQFNRPDFNLGPLLYYFTYPFIDVFGDKEFAFRLVILISFIINVFLIYKNGLLFFGSQKKAFLSSLVYSILPITYYYGVRYQNEELMFMFYNLSIFYYMNYIKTNRVLSLFISGLSIGISIFLVKQTFLPFIVIFILFLIYKNYNSKKQVIKSLLIYIFGLIIPLFILILMFSVFVPAYLHPLKFYFNRIYCGILIRSKFGGTYLSNTNKYPVFVELLKNFILTYGYIGIFALLFLTVKLLIRNNLINQRMCLIFSFILLNFFIGVISIYVLRFHIRIHDYYYYLILLPLTFYITELITYIYNKIQDIFINNFKWNSSYIRKIIAIVILVVVVGLTVLPSYNAYNKFHDPFANNEAVNVGKYIRKITDSNDTILVPSPVIGYYAHRPNLLWNYLWMLNLTYLNKKPLFSCQPILNVTSIYMDYQHPDRIIEMFEYWRPRIVVVSPDVSGIIINHYKSLMPFVAYFNLFYHKNLTETPYTVFVRNNNLKTLFYFKDIKIISSYIGKQKWLVLLFNNVPLMMFNIYFSDNLTFDIMNANKLLVKKSYKDFYIINKYGRYNLTVDQQDDFFTVYMQIFSNLSRFNKVIFRLFLKFNVSVRKNTVEMLYDRYIITLTASSKGKVDILLGKNKNVIVIKSTSNELKLLFHIYEKSKGDSFVVKNFNIFGEKYST